MTPQTEALNYRRESVCDDDDDKNKERGERTDERQYETHLLLEGSEFEEQIVLLTELTCLICEEFEMLSQFSVLP